MRYPDDHKQRTRGAIVAAAARLFRKGGYPSVGVDQVMGELGLTAGGFYAHFTSKEALLGDALAHAIEQGWRRWGAGLEAEAPEARVEALVARYFSAQVTKSAEPGCPLPALSADVGRASLVLRGRLERELKRGLDELGRFPPAAGLSGPDRALATLALCLGGVLLARAVKSPAFSRRIVSACRRYARAFAQERA